MIDGLKGCNLTNYVAGGKQQEDVLIPISHMHMTLDK